jgi:hypothetical protein
MKTEIIVITDRSGSMQSIKPDVIGGFNTFLDDQKKETGEARITYSQFDSIYELVYAGIPIKDAPKLTDGTFVPRGMTALYDAVGRTLDVQGKRIAEEKWAELVVVCIITDGGENASREYSSARVQEMTKHAEANGWKFIFLAANQDAMLAAKSFGSSGQYAGGFAASSAGVASAYAATSMTMSSLRSGADVQSLVQKQ